jgi:hypothetical protein
MSATHGLAAIRSWDYVKRAIPEGGFLSLPGFPDELKIESLEQVGTCLFSRRPFERDVAASTSSSGASLRRLA